MNKLDIPFLSLLIVLSLAFIVPILVSGLKRFWIPLVIGEILAGIIFGKSGLGLIQENTVLQILAELGFIYLMFLSGLEINFSTLLAGRSASDGQRSILKSPLVLGAGTYAITLAVSGVIAWGLSALGWIHPPWLIALILSTTSLGIVVPVLKEKKMSRNAYGQLILVATIIADFGSIFLVSIFFLLQSKGPTFEILLFLILLAAFAVVYRMALFLRKNFPAERFFEDLSSATSQFRLRGSLVLTLIFIVLAENLGVENILGAFLAGAIIANISGDNSLLQKKLDAIGYGFFIPIFFVMVGVDFDFRALFSSTASAMTAPALIVAAFAVKLISVLPFRLIRSRRETVSAGLLMSARLSLIIAVATIGVKTGMITEAVNAAVVLTAIITCTVAPILFDAVAPAPLEKPDGVLVIGCRNLGEMLAAGLTANDRDVRMICSETVLRHDRAHEGGTAPASEHLYEYLNNRIKNEPLEQYDTLVTMLEDDGTALRLCRMARDVFDITHIISWVNDPVHNPYFLSLGARIVNPSYSTLLLLQHLVLNPEASSMAADMDEDMAYAEIPVTNTALEHKSLIRLKLPDQVAVLQIRRGTQTLIPQNETLLEPDDILTLVGPEEEVTEAVKRFGRQNIPVTKKRPGQSKQATSK